MKYSYWCPSKKKNIKLYIKEILFTIMHTIQSQSTTFLSPWVLVVVVGGLLSGGNKVRNRVPRFLTFCNSCFPMPCLDMGYVGEPWVINVCKYKALGAYWKEYKYFFLLFPAYQLINGPCVAGAVLQTALSLINSVNNSVSHGLWKYLKAPPRPNGWKWCF